MQTDLLTMILASVLLFFSICSFYLSSWAFSRRKRVAGAIELCICLLATGLFIIGYAFELTIGTLNGIFWALRIQLTGLPLITYSFLMFSIRFITEKRIARPLRLGLLAVPVLIAVAAYTMSNHELLFTSPSISNNGLFPVLNFKPGILYIVHTAYLIIVSVSAETILIIGIIRNAGRKRSQILIVSIAGFLPILTGALTPLRFHGIDLQPFVLPLTGVLLAIALYRYKMLELVPRAKEFAVDSIRELLIVLDSSGRIQDLNAAAQASRLLLDAKAGDHLPSGSPLCGFISDISVNETDREKKNRLKFEYENRNYNLNISLVKDDEGDVSGYVLIVSDDTRTVRLMRELEHQAIFDELTQVFNRRHILNLASREVELARRNGWNLGVILMDIDFFKNINDKYGHLAGDMILKNCTDALGRELRITDQMGRYGGEEFLVICPNSDSSTTLRIAERLRSSVESIDSRYNDIEIKITASFGVESMPVSDTTILNDLLINADKALYKAKAGGRNRVDTLLKL